MPANDIPGPGNGDSEFWKNAQEQLQKRLDEIAIVKVDETKAQAKKIKIGLRDVFRKPFFRNELKGRMGKFFNVLLENFDAAKVRAVKRVGYHEYLKPSNLFNKEVSLVKEKLDNGLELPKISLAEKSTSVNLLVDDLVIQANLRELFNDKYFLELFMPQHNAYLSYGHLAIPDEGEAVFINPKLMESFKEKFDEKVDDFLKKAEEVKDLHSAPKDLVEKVPVKSEPKNKLHLNGYEKLIDSKVEQDLSDPVLLLKFVRALRYILSEKMGGKTQGKVELKHLYDEKFQDSLNYNHNQPDVPANIPLYNSAKNIKHGYLRLGKNIDFGLELSEPREARKKPTLKLTMPQYEQALLFDLNEEIKPYPTLDNAINAFVYDIYKLLEEDQLANKAPPSGPKAEIKQANNDLLEELYRASSSYSQETFENVIEKVNAAMPRANIRIDSKMTKSTEMAYDSFLQGEIAVGTRIVFAFRLWNSKDEDKPDTMAINANLIGGKTASFAISANQSERAESMIKQFTKLLDERVDR
ncbi:MAG: hypothetical protein HRT47_08260 [Candidatus Caenarcaniphilales bacterium]|nr:hypothetical protein [Candidatus Caenarcaniphilales bacterium]